MKPSSEDLDAICPRDVAAYVRDVAEQLASMAPLDEARRAAAEALQGNAAPEDAA